MVFSSRSSVMSQSSGRRRIRLRAPLSLQSLVLSSSRLSSSGKFARKHRPRDLLELNVHAMGSVINRVDPTCLAQATDRPTWKYCLKYSFPSLFGLFQAFSGRRESRRTIETDLPCVAVTQSRPDWFYKKVDFAIKLQKSGVPVSRRLLRRSPRQITKVFAFSRHSINARQLAMKKLSSSL